MSEERLMDLKEVAAYLNVTDSAVYNWVQDGTLPAFRVGRLWRFRRSELDKWLEANRNVVNKKTSDRGELHRQKNDDGRDLE